MGLLDSLKEMFGKGTSAAGGAADRASDAAGDAMDKAGDAADKARGMVDGDDKPDTNAGPGPTGPAAN